MKSYIQPLVVTPRPEFGESLKGFILRTSEINGYSSPYYMLKHAGMANDKISSQWPPINKLAKLFARDPSSFDSMGYKLCSGRQAYVMGHRLTVLNIQSSSPRICPECVMNSGIIDAFSDIRYAIVCPIHKRKAIHACPSCGKSLSWSRPGILKCRCGHDLSKCRGDIVDSDAVIYLLNIIRNKLRNEQAASSKLENCGFPVENLESMSLDTLLKICNRLEPQELRKDMTRSNSRAEFALEALTSIANVFRNWPTGFYDYLNSLKSEQQHEEASWQKQFESFYSAFLTHKMPHNEIDFIRKSYLSYGMDRWRNEYIPNKLSDTQKDDSHLVVGVTAMADILGVHYQSVHRFVKTGFVNAQEVTIGNQTRMVFDLSDGLPLKPAAGRNFTKRDAARFLTIPENVFEYLHQHGHFQVMHFTVRPTKFHELDLMAFRERILGDTQFFCGSPHPDHQITLGNIMEMKRFMNCELKAKLIIDILGGKVKPLGKIHDDIDGLVLDKILITYRMKSARKKIYYCGLKSVAAAAKLLSCENITIPSMISKGLLEGIKKPWPAGLQVTEESIKQFSAQYISCIGLANIYSMHFNQILSRCKERNIPLLKISKSNSRKSLQSFVKRDMVALLGFEKTAKEIIKAG
jgi:hypothetical protein